MSDHTAWETFTQNQQDIIIKKGRCYLVMLATRMSNQKAGFHGVTFGSKSEAVTFQNLVEKNNLVVVPTTLSTYTYSSDTEAQVKYTDEGKKAVLILMKSINDKFGDEGNG